MKEIRRGILLAKHDFQLALFEERHKDKANDPIVVEMREIYQTTEKLIIGNHQLTDLTVEAYYRTLLKLGNY